MKLSQKVQGRISGFVFGVLVMAAGIVSYPIVMASNSPLLRAAPCKIVPKKSRRCLML